MTWWQSLLLLFGLLTFLLLVGLPAGFAFLAINLVGAVVYLGGEAGLMQVVRNGVASVTNFSLTPIPFFILMGEVLFHTGLAMKAIASFDRAIRGVPGRLSVVAIVAGTVFSAISGSTIATTALLGGLLLPEMLKRGYHPRMAMGPIMAIGGVDMLIPPSALTVLLGSLAGISISGLLIAGVVPGMLLAVMFLVWIITSAIRHPEHAPAFEREEAVGWQRWRPLLVHVTPLLLIFMLVIVAMSAGWATPTESAAVGVVMALLLCIAYGKFSIAMLHECFVTTVSVTAMIMLIAAAAFYLNFVLGLMGVPQALANFASQLGTSQLTMLLVLTVFYLILGCFLDALAMVIGTIPIVFPLITALGIDAVWFGIYLVVMAELALITPPVGMNLYVVQGIRKEGLITDVIVGTLPFLFMMLLLVVLLVVWPDLALWLPRVSFG